MFSPSLVSCRTYWITGCGSPRYGVCARLDNVDDNALAYLSRVLPYLTLCGITYYDIRVKNKWQARMQSWHTLDEVLLRLCGGRARSVQVMVDPTADIPSWETLPYSCEDDLSKEMLPRCAAGGLTEQHCRDGGRPKACKLHNSRR